MNGNIRNSLCAAALLAVVLAAGSAAAETAIVDFWDNDTLTAGDVVGARDGSATVSRSLILTSANRTSWYSCAPFVSADEASAVAAGEHVEFSLDTRGFSAITLSFADMRSATGPRQMRCYWSATGPAGEFTSHSQVFTPSETESARVLDLSAIEELDDNADVVLRLVAWDPAGGSEQEYAIRDISIEAQCGPRRQAKDILYTYVSGAKTADLSWIKGSGRHRIIVARRGGAVDALPQQRHRYSANAQFGLGDEIGTGNFVIYNGNGADMYGFSFADEGTYGIRIFEYSKTFLFGTPYYNKNAATDNPVSAALPVTVSGFGLD